MVSATASREIGLVRVSNAWVIALLLADFSAAALAQSGSTTQPATESSPTNDTGRELTEIVVTARKKEETLLNVPASITAITGTALEQSGTQNVSQLIGIVPGLFKTQNQTFGPAPSQTFLVIRGVGATAASDPAVGTFVDGVYQTSLAFDADLIDVENVEVLRGPQGALFGRNTEGGAINIITRMPSSDFSAKVQADLGSFDTSKISAMVSGPIVDEKFFASAAFEYARSDGYLENITLGEHQDDSHKYLGRTTLRFIPIDDLEIIVRGNAASSWLGYVGYGVPDDGTERYVTLDNQKVPSTIDNYGASTTINYKLAGMELTSITGYTRVRTNYWFDFDSSASAGGSQNQITGQQSTSEELRLSGSIGRWADWLVGYYDFGEDYDQVRHFVIGPDCDGCTVPGFFSPDNYVLEEANFVRRGDAEFAQMVFHPLEKLDITAAARYSSERVVARQAGIIRLPALPAFDSFDGTNAKRFDNFSPSGSISYHWTPSVTNYVTVSEGYKPGGYDKYPGSSAAVGIPFGSETSTNYEAGIKAELFGRRVFVQSDVFDVKIKNQQLATTVTSPTTGIPVGATANVGKSSSRGFEFEGAVYPIRDLRLSVSTAYVDARFDEFASPIGTLKPGDAFPYVPPWTGSMQAEYTQHLSGEQAVTLGSYYNYVDAHYNGDGNPPFDPMLHVPHYETLDMRVMWRAQPVELSVFVNNVTDRYNITSRYQPVFWTYTRNIVLPPRSFGVRASYSW